MASNVYCRVTIAYSSPWSIPKQHREAVLRCPAHLRRWKCNSPRLVMAGANPCETAVLDPHRDAWHCVSNRSENNLAKEKVCLERLSRVCFRLCDTGTDRNMETGRNIGTVRRSEGPGSWEMERLMGRKGKWAWRLGRGSYVGGHMTLLL